MRTTAKAKVFVVPHQMAHHRVVDRILREAADVEIIYGLDGDEVWQPPVDDTERSARISSWKRQLEEALPELDALFASGGDSPLIVDNTLLERAKRLQVVFLPGAGSDRVDLAAATARGVAVVNAPGANATAVADHTIGLMITCSMRIGLADRHMHRERRWIRLSAMTEIGEGPRAVSDQTVGLVGFGFIGREVGRKCISGFRMRVLAYDPFFDPVEMQRQGVTPARSLEEMIPQCDFVSVHVPHTEANHHLIGERELSLMKPTAFVINTSRGANVDQAALIRACRERRIAGAGIDVADPEPLPDGHPLFDLENVVVTPHAAGGGTDYLEKMATAAASNALDVLRGRRPFHLLNPDAWPLLLKRREGGLAEE
jgi:D-3-phosphoglycerate dehydrogenase / 2-oxoglutarate reductase